MAQFEEVTALPTIEQIEATVQKNGGLIRSYGYGFDMPRQEGRVGPWRVAVVDRRGMGNHGWVIAIAMTRDAFTRQKKTTIDRHRLWAKPIRKR